MTPWNALESNSAIVGRNHFKCFLPLTLVPPLVSLPLHKDTVGGLVVDFTTASTLDFTTPLRILDFLVMTDYFPSFFQETKASCFPIIACI